MPGRVFGIPGDGQVRLIPGEPYLRKLQTFIARRFGREENSLARIREATDALLAHPYLIVNRRHTAEDDYKKARIKRCVARREGLCELLDRGEVAQYGIEQATGQAKLTSARLRDRFVRLLDVDDNWLLISLERHPRGGAETFLVQWWLYGRRERAVHLVHVEEQAAAGPMTAGRVGGVWENIDTSLEDHFYSQVAELLGGQAVETLKRATQFQDVALCMANSEVLHRCSRIVGFDVEEAEQRSERVRASAFEARYGTEPGPRVAWVSVDAGFRLGFKRDHPARTTTPLGEDA